MDESMTFGHVDSLGVRARVLVAAALSMAVGSAGAVPGYSYKLIAQVNNADYGSGYRLCSFALNNVGQVAYMVSRDTAYTDGTVELWFHDGTAPQLVYSAGVTDEISLRCNQLTGSSVPSNVGLRDDGLISFGLYTTNNEVVLAYGRAGVGIEGIAKNALGAGAYFVGPTINASGRAGFIHGAGGNAVTFGTVEGSVDGTTTIKSSATVSLQKGFVTAPAAAINDRNQAAAFYRDNYQAGDPVVLGFSDPSAAPGSQLRLLRLGTLLEVNPRPGQPSLNEKGMVAFGSPQNGSVGDPGRVLAIDPAGAASLITVADTTSGRFSDFGGITSINEFNQIAFQAFVGDPVNDFGVYVGNTLGADPIDVLVSGQVISMPGLTATYAGVAVLATQSLNDSGQVLFLARTVDAGDLLVLATPMAGLTLRQSEVAGCKSTTGTVTLMSPAPAGGTVVALSDTLTSATVPTSVMIPAGATRVNFTVRTTPVLVSEIGGVSVTHGGSTANRPLTVRPMGMLSVSLTPTSVVGGNMAVGRATLECNAVPGPIAVDLSSNNPGVAYPIAASVVVPQGLKSANFDVATNTVQTKSYATISGTANGITKSKKLAVNVAASVSPTRLGFGNQNVGTTSAPLSVTLTNRGATPFSVSAISLTGTGASWFAQTNNCPANLAAGASCTISVTFTPQTALSKTAKLSVATSGTSAPLGVSLSGTGLLPQ
jgi:hypothetical protein